MATRATYQIHGTTFYCHWDGYPEGAANRFARMIGALTVPDSDQKHMINATEQRRGGEAFAFIRGVHDAEPTTCHADHDDTEFRYTVSRSERGGLWIEVTAYNFSSDTWKHHSCGDLADWINTQRLTEIGQGIPRIVRINEPTNHGYKPPARYATIEAAEQIADRLAAMAARFGEDNPNRASCLAREAAWREAVTVTSEAA